MIIPGLSHYAVYAVNNKDTALYPIGNTFLLLNSSLNPVIYYHRNPRFKANSTKLLHLNLHRGPVEPPKAPTARASDTSNSAITLWIDESS